MDSVPPKLTKKQRKAVAFRERKGKQVDEQRDLPEVDVADEDTTELVPPADLTPTTPTSGTKRKRGDGDPSQPLAKKMKQAAEPSTTDVSEGTKDAKKKNQRYILFVGNLSYKTTKESVEQHFSSCPDPPSVRLLAPKPRPGATTSRSKGCAFIEFPTSRSLQAALRLHHSDLDDRTINVELTSGGGGSGEKRKEVLRSRNKALEEERDKTRKNKEARGDTAVIPAIGQRHSTTSGTGSANAYKPKTWTVPEGDEKSGRGGKKHAKKQQRGERGGRPQTKKAWAPSGANAVAVG